MVANDDVTDNNQQYDLASMWEEASLEYYTIMKKKPSEMKRFRNVDDILKDEDVQNSFKKFRDYGGPVAGDKVAKLRHLISANSCMILKGCDFIKDAASAAFPPSASVLTALTYVLKASKSIQKDYDDIQSFFEEMKEFLERLQMIEKNVPQYAGYRAQLMRVFSAMMSLLGLASKAKSEGRFLRFGKSFVRGGGDDSLSGARSKLETTLARLESATSFATLAVGYDNLEQGKLIKEDTGAIREGQVVITEQIVGISQGMQVMMEKWDQFMVVQRRGKSSLSADGPGSKMEGKPSALQSIRGAIKIEDDPSIVDRDIEWDFIEDASKWLLDSEQYLAWRDDPSSDAILWLTGEAGTGKTYLTYAATQDLRKSTAAEANTYVVRHYCRQGWDERAVALTAFKSAVVQLAAVDADFCAEVTVQIARHGAQFIGDKSGVWFWQNLIATKFAKGSTARLFFVLDGLDEVNVEPGCIRYFRKGLIFALRQLVADGLEIRVLISGRTHWTQNLDKAALPYSGITITKKLAINDMRAYVDRRLKTSSRLRKARLPVRRKIKAILVQKADCMLYLVHMLRRLNSMQHEKMILEELVNAPEGLQSLFARIEKDIYEKRTPEQVYALRHVYSWLIFCEAQLTVGEVNAIAFICGKYQAFNIEEEVLVRSAPFLDIEGENGNLDDENDDEDGEDSEEEAIYDDQRLLESLKADDGKRSTLNILNRTLWEYLCAGQPAEWAIRMSSQQAHFNMFDTCIKLLCNMAALPYMNGARTLFKYAATYWGKHFQQLDLPSASDEMIIEVSKLLKFILTNENDAASFIECNRGSDGDPTEFYFHSLGITSAEKNDFMEKLIPWLRRTVETPGANSDAALMAWVQESIKTPQRVFAPLALGHLSRWLADSPPERYSYGFAVDVLNLVLDLSVICVLAADQTVTD